MIQALKGKHQEHRTGFLSAGLKKFTIQPYHPFEIFDCAKPSEELFLKRILSCLSFS